MISTVQSPVLEQLSSSSSLNSTGGKLPAENAVVLVKVLERLDGNYRLLVDGSVFQARLPFNAGEQEEFLARVLTAKPLLLQADSFTNLKNITPAILSVLLKKLGISEKAETKQILEILLQRKRPIIKSKIEMIAGALDDNKKLDDLQAALLAGLFYATTQEMTGFCSEAKRLFRDSIGTIIEEIFTIVRVSLQKKSDVCVRPALEAAFISPEGRKAQSARKLFDLAQHLTRFAQARGIYGADDEAGRAAELSSLLTEYLVQKAVYNRFHVYPDFIISRFNGDYSLSVFNHAKDAPDGKISVSCDLVKNGNNAMIRLRGSLEEKVARLVCFSSAMTSVIGRYMHDLHELMTMNSFDVSVYLQDVKKAGEALPALSSVNCKV